MKNPIIVNGYCTNVSEDDNGNRFLIISLNDPSVADDENLISVPVPKEISKQVTQALDDCFVIVATLTGHVTAHNFQPVFKFEKIDLDYIKSEGRVQNKEALN